MSEEINPPRRTISYDEFLDFLIEKKVKSECPSCGTDAAFISSEDDASIAAQTRMDVVEFDKKTNGLLKTSSTTILALSTVCANCGYIRNYASQTLLEWAQEKLNKSVDKEQ